MAPGNSGRTGKGIGDVASLVGRILRAVFIYLVVGTVLLTSPLQAAPFAAIVMDARTGEILYEKNARTRLHPASLTKMMTLYIAFQEIEAGRLSPDTRVTVSKYAAAQPPSRLGLKPGQKIALRYLIRAAAVKSANDAAAAIGDHISGDAATFAKRMTKTARSLGMHDTTFRNAHGLTADGHLSTAYDMNILGRHLFYDFPQYYNIFSRRTADAGIAEVRNTNSRFLDGYEGADGIKTGYTSAAGFNLTASALRGNKRIIATVFGSTSTAARNAKMAELMDIGFGAAKNRVKEQPPETPAPLPSDALIASAEPEIDEIDAEGGAGKTVRVSGGVSSSPRPKSRPGVPAVPDEVALAMAASIDGALAEATAEPAPPGTLDFQAETMAAAPETALAAAEPAAEPAVEALPAPVELAAAAPQPAPEPGTLDAQAATLADSIVPADTTLAAAEPAPAPGTLDAQAAALAEAVLPAETELAAAVADPALAELKPQARPETLAPVADASPVPEEVPVELAAATPEEVVTDPGLPEPAPIDLALAEPLPEALPEITAVETVAAAATMAPVEPAATAPARQAPIFDTVEVAETPAAAQEEVVVVMSTSGGRHFGVNVGEYPSRYEAERALLKTALAESATLNEGLRKTSQADGAWRASFMGLTEEQAELACRRLRARAVPCETVGG
ncbi:D-alanyl-D-alanine carboxypeptidase family protein [Tabrizicola aquatica]|uniref:D-alanyl-D-alanine carboxypeptidase family protein n=1 Tax=Tabrizicola aquatica TaxID=909926 RepID=UPI000CD1EF5F